MNLLKVEDKLKAREYRTVEEVLDHIQLVWDNCKTYNPEGQYYILADKMQRNFKKMIRNYLPNIPVIVPSIFSFTQSLLVPKLLLTKSLLLHHRPNLSRNQSHPGMFRSHNSQNRLRSRSSHVVNQASLNKFPNPRKIVSINV